MVVMMIMIIVTIMYSSGISNNSSYKEKECDYIYIH